MLRASHLQSCGAVGLILRLVPHMRASTMARALRDIEAILQVRSVLGRSQPFRLPPRLFLRCPIMPPQSFFTFKTGARSFFELSCS